MAISRSKRKICVITGTRAEYGLLYWVLRGLESDPKVQLQLVVTGAHLSQEFGSTYQEIEKDGFKIDWRVDMELSDDSDAGITKSTAVGLKGFADAFEALKPDLILVLGDRYELIPSACAALFFKIPIAHLYGGESTEGIIDEAVRHSLTKMSHIHFTANKDYRKRIIQLGEHPDSVFSVGSLGIENIKKTPLLSKKELEAELNFQFGKKNLIVTFHPVTLEKKTSESQFIVLLETLDRLPDTKIIFTKTNADADGRIINELIDKYVERHRDKSACYISLGMVKYLSVLQFVNAVVGNSSSGIIEAPSFNIGTINIGDRQLGRIRPSSVIDCSPNASAITEAFDKLYSVDFQSKLEQVENPYGDGISSQKIINELKNVDLVNILKKKFYDIEFDLAC